MKSDLLHILQHSLGVDHYGRGRQYRNLFVTGEGSADYPLCRQLVELGLMKDHGAYEFFGGDHRFTVTEKGRFAMIGESPEPPKLTASQKRYRNFLHADSGLSFKEWLKYETAR